MNNGLRLKLTIGRGRRALHSPRREYRRRHRGFAKIDSPAAGIPRPYGSCKTSTQDIHTALEAFARDKVWSGNGRVTNFPAQQPAVRGRAALEQGALDRDK